MSSRNVALGLALAGGLLAIACAAVAVAADKTEEGYLGVFLEPVPQILAVHLGLAEGVGVVAADVAADSPAEKSGLGQYDVIVSMNGKDVKGMDTLSSAIRAAGAGSKVKLGLITKGQKKEIEVTLGALSEATGKGKHAAPKGGRRLLKEGGRPDENAAPGDITVVPGPNGNFRLSVPGPMAPRGGPDDGFSGPAVDDRLQALEDRIAELEKQQAEMLEKLDRALSGTKSK